MTGSRGKSGCHCTRRGPAFPTPAVPFRGCDSLPTARALPEAGLLCVFFSHLINILFPLCLFNTKVAPPTHRVKSALGGNVLILHKKGSCSQTVTAQKLRNKTDHGGGTGNCGKPEGSPDPAQVDGPAVEHGGLPGGSAPTSTETGAEEAALGSCRLCAPEGGEHVQRPGGSLGQLQSPPPPPPAPLGPTGPLSWWPHPQHSRAP